MSNEKYEEAIAYFNRAGESSSDSIAYTYDNQKNVLIKQHGEINSMATGGLIGVVGGAASVAFLASSAHDTFTAEDSAAAQEAFPDVSIGFTLFFGVLYMGAKRGIKKTVKAVDRDVREATANKTQPVL